MLQIITGKFFKSDKLHVTECKGITYSNISWVGKIETNIATIEPVETYRGISSYVISYQNKIEKIDSPTQIVRIGDREILEQLQYLLIFCLRASFNPDKAYVEFMCREKPTSHSDNYVPSQFVDSFFQPMIHLKNQDVENLKIFIDKVLNLKREKYKKIIDCLRIISHSLEILNYNIDLSYSLLVFALETLSQSFDDYDPVWNDYEDKIRNKLDKEFESLANNKVSQIKTILLESSHLRLQKRFLDFISENVSDSYFVNISKEIKNPLKKSQLNRVLKNCYQLRSTFSHRLVPILKRLKTSGINQFDTFPWDNEPYLTYRGLIRMTHHVISNFIAKQDKVSKEDYEWINDLPGMSQLVLAPEYWVAEYEYCEEKDANKRLTGFLTILIDLYTGNRNAIVDLNKLLEKFEQLVPSANKENRLSMLTLYYLYNESVPLGERRPNYIEFVEKHEKDLLKPNIQNLIILTITNQDFSYEIDEALTTYDEYCKTKYSKNSIQVPTILEIAIVLKIAKKFFELGKKEVYSDLYQRAIWDLPSFSDLQSKIQYAKENEKVLDVNDILRPQMIQNKDTSNSSNTIY